MRVISTTGTRSIFCILRENGNLNNYTVYVTNESTNVTTTIDITQTPIQITSNNNQIEIVFTDDYVEGDELSYYVTELGSDEVLHRNKIFVTDQVTQDYSYE